MQYEAYLTSRSVVVAESLMQETEVAVMLQLLQLAYQSCLLVQFRLARENSIHQKAAVLE
jgi:hypothetical protein